jgi:hypothetical protein
MLEVSPFPAKRTLLNQAGGGKCFLVVRRKGGSSGLISSVAALLDSSRLLSPSERLILLPVPGERLIKMVRLEVGPEFVADVEISVD